jgi:hypothetical protein
MNTTKKQRTGKIVSLGLIAFSLIKLFSHLRNNEFSNFRLNDYLICGSLLIIFICGVYGYRKSVLNQKK